MAGADKVIKEAAKRLANPLKNTDDAVAFDKKVNTAVRGRKAASSTYGTPSVPDVTAVKDGSAFATSKGGEQFSKFLSAAKGTLQSTAMEEGRTVLGMAGSHAIRGAAWGGVIGGTVEAAQGGSFWDGAKQGAFNGAVGWTGYRMGMKAVGSKANPLNPMAGPKSLWTEGNKMYRSFSNDAEISGQAMAILNQRQINGVAQSVMNQRKATARKG